MRGKGFVPAIAAALLGVPGPAPAAPPAVEIQSYAESATDTLVV